MKIESPFSQFIHNYLASRGTDESVQKPDSFKEQPSDKTMMRNSVANNKLAKGFILNSSQEHRIFSKFQTHYDQSHALTKNTNSQYHSSNQVIDPSPGNNIVQADPSSVSLPDVSVAPFSYETFSDPVKITTFNTYGYKNVNVTNEVNHLIQNNDIVGLQEPSFDEMVAYAAANKDTHGVILGLENGSSDGEYAPIIFNKNKYDAVHASSIHLPGGDRVATFAVLRDKSSGSLIVVGNTHLASNNAIEDRIDNLEFVKDLVQDLVTRYGADGSVLLGDFNMRVGSQGGSYSGAALPTYEGGSNIDGVLVFEPDADATDPIVTDGGASDHNAVTREVRFRYNEDESKNNFDIPTLNFSRLNLIIHPDQTYKRSDEYKLEEAYGLESSRPRTGRASTSNSPHREHDIINDRPIYSTTPTRRSGRGSGSNHSPSSDLNPSPKPRSGR